MIVLLVNRFCILAYSYKIVCTCSVNVHCFVWIFFLCVIYYKCSFSHSFIKTWNSAHLKKKSGRHLFKLIRARQDIGTEMCEGFDF